MYFFFFFFFLLYFFLGNAVLKLHIFKLAYCVSATVIMCHFLCSLMAFDRKEIKELLTYLLNSYVLIIKSFDRLLIALPLYQWSYCCVRSLWTKELTGARRPVVGHDAHGGYRPPWVVVWDGAFVLEWRLYVVIILPWPLDHVHTDYNSRPVVYTLRRVMRHLVAYVRGRLDFLCWGRRRYPWMYFDIQFALSFYTIIPPRRQIIRPVFQLPYYLPTWAENRENSNVK